MRSRMFLFSCGIDRNTNQLIAHVAQTGLECIVTFNAFFLNGDKKWINIINVYLKLYILSNENINTHIFFLNCRTVPPKSGIKQKDFLLVGNDEPLCTHVPFFYERAQSSIYTFCHVFRLVFEIFNSKIFKTYIW